MVAGVEMIKTETTARERRLHKEGMDKYVFEPSRDYAAAFALIGLGVGLCIVATAVTGSWLSPFLFIGSTVSIFAGVGWALMIKDRLNAYYFDIMEKRTIDETTITRHEEVPTAPRQITNSNGDVVVELETAGKLDARQWRDVAYAILIHKLPISQNVFSKDKDTKIMSQPQYKWWYDHMLKNHYMTTENGNELTRAGIQKLENYLPAPKRE